MMDVWPWSMVIGDAESATVGVLLPPEPPQPSRPIKGNAKIRDRETNDRETRDSRRTVPPEKIL
jgi:hypothetical protein